MTNYPQATEYRSRFGNVSWIVRLSMFAPTITIFDAQDEADAIAKARAQAAKEE